MAYGMVDIGKRLISLELLARSSFYWTCGAPFSGSASSTPVKRTDLNPGGWADLFLCFYYTPFDGGDDIAIPLITIQMKRIWLDT
jgi:hypothetical protein